MQKWTPKQLKKRAVRAYHRVGGSDVVKRRDVAMAFAEKHGLVYFHTVSADSDKAPVIRGSTVAPKHIDSNFCLGTHAGYDMAIIERTADVEFGDFEPSFHHWYVLEIDLKHARELPYLFVGTKQQSKAYYARVLTSHRGVAHLQFHSKAHAGFGGNYVVIASPNDLPLLERLFDDETVAMMAAHKWPFSLETDGDSIILTTLAEKPSEQLIDKLLHYGLWFAKRIDEKLV